MMAIDWPLLQQQKQLLVELRAGQTVTAEQEESIEGILNLLDSIQDQAVDSGDVPEAVVFGQPAL